jgi:hypothetical protein
MNKNVFLVAGVLIGLSMFSASPVSAQGSSGRPAPGCPVSQSELKAALSAVRGMANGGFNLDMWGTAMNRDGIVCAVAFTGGNRGDGWPGSHVISAQKANTTNAFSLPGHSLSTANLWAAVQPGGSLFGLQESNPVDTGVAYKGPSSNFGTAADPWSARRLTAVNVFGGGLALYNAEGTLVGVIGVSGDASCADHNIAWRPQQPEPGLHAKRGSGPPGERTTSTTTDSWPSRASGTISRIPSAKSPGSTACRRLAPRCG